MSQINGHISQIIGPVIDVYYETQGLDPEKVLPKIHDALKIKRADGRDLVVEVQQHIGEDTVRCVAMDNTDGLQRGLEAITTGSPILMPSGDQIKGRMLNVIGQPIDGMKGGRHTGRTVLIRRVGEIVQLFRMFIFAVGVEETNSRKT